MSLALAAEQLAQSTSAGHYLRPRGSKHWIELSKSLSISPRNLLDPAVTTSYRANPVDSPARPQAKLVATPVHVVDDSGCLGRMLDLRLAEATLDYFFGQRLQEPSADTSTRCPGPST